jgi:hypothetical protein
VEDIHPGFRSPLAHGCEEARLADSGTSFDQNEAPGSSARRLGERTELRELAFPLQQIRCWRQCGFLPSGPKCYGFLWGVSSSRRTHGVASIRRVERQGREQAVTDLEYPARRERTKASSWGVIPVALAVTSFVGIVMLLILDAADYAENGVWNDVFWQVFSLGGILALLTGAAVYVVGRRRRDSRAMRVGMVGVAWFVIALLIVIIAAAVS